MTIFRMLRFCIAVFFAVVACVLADLLRRCVIVDAWSIAPYVVVVLVLSLYATRMAWRAARRSRLPTDFVRPKQPQSPDFPDTPKRGIR
ncbi:hypothetical protein [Xanthomonas albilineans]|uniref:Uncharacterized protein n=1 Tax=Xanthomonas albilineans (strain GPE PC73 / CFBP 7063) TaxID=380358 RepID=D2U8R9_XANAP|nr:hypothetical protein [Xanthomonas albilineans]CBA14725.1 hypothetical protein XALC_0179 [Xanthomonas albilineans GPE PC73]